jgi:hypothetical protein
MSGFFFFEYPLYRSSGWSKKKVVVRFWSKIYSAIVIDIIYLYYIVISNIVGFKVGVIFFIWSFFAIVSGGAKVDSSYYKFFVLLF